MRFIWFALPARNLSEQLSQGERAIGSAEKKERHTESEQLRKDLQSYFEAQDEKHLNKAERERFKKILESWDSKNDVESIRTAGVDEKTNRENYLRRHVLLSQEFLKKGQGSDIEFKVDFHGNELAEWRVGAGDMLPPSVTKIRLKRADGSESIGIRAQNPRTKRIGYFEENGLRQNPPQYEYMAVHSGDKISVLETGTIPAQGSPQTFREHMAIYSQGAAKSDVVERSERRFDPNTGAVYENDASAIRAQRTAFMDAARNRRGEVITDPGVKRPEGLYQRTGRDFWTNICGNNESQVRRYIITKDPLTGEPVTFLGRKILGGINKLLLPYLKEAEERIKSSGLDYRIDRAESFNWRNIKKPDGTFSRTTSYHAYGAAIDLNAGKNAQSTEGEMPEEFGIILESVGFSWGRRWGGAHKDPMHFQLDVNPYASTGLLTSENAKRYATAILGKDALSPAAGRKQQESAKTAPEKNKPLADKVNSATSRWLELIKQSCERHNVPVQLVQAIMFNESGGRSNARGKNTNGTVDQGLMQLNNAYFKDPNIMDPSVNIDIAVKLIKRHLVKYGGDIGKVAEAYNCGHAKGEVIKGRTLGIPRMTEGYRDKIVAAYNALSAESSDLRPKPGTSVA